MRAGRNLPDKEFRYLSTVIVTAAVYRGFDSRLAPLLLTVRHRAGVRPFTSACDFAEPCVFAKQSPPPGLCPLCLVAQAKGLLIPKLRRHIAEFLQPSSLKRLGMLYQSTCVGFGYGLMRGLFPGTPTLPEQNQFVRQLSEFVTTRWPTNIDVVPIDYAFRPRLRDRLTLRRLALRRNPWTFGDSVSHTVCRYSCQHSHFCNLQELSRVSLRRRQNAPLPLGGQNEDDIRRLRSVLRTLSFGSWVQPRYIFGAGTLV